MCVPCFLHWSWILNLFLEIHSWLPSCLILVSSKPQFPINLGVCGCAQLHWPRKNYFKIDHCQDNCRRLPISKWTNHRNTFMKRDILPSEKHAGVKGGNKTFSEWQKICFISFLGKTKNQSRNQSFLLAPGGKKHHYWETFWEKADLDDEDVLSVIELCLEIKIIFIIYLLFVLVVTKYTIYCYNISVQVSLPIRILLTGSKFH